STASVPAGTAGAVTTITVQVRDANGNARSDATGVSAVAASVTGANTATPTVTNNSDGTYTLTYTPTTSGTDNVAITMNTGAGAVAISGSPFTSAVAAGAVASFAVDAAGGGAIGAQTAGSSFNIRVRALDAHSNVATSFTGTVTLTSPSAISAGAGPSAAFTAGVLASHAITLTTAGATQTVTATRTGSAETGTSASFAVSAASASASQSTASVPSGTAGASTAITVTARDAFGNALTSGGATVVASVAGANTGATVNVVDNSNGTYALSYTPTAAGTDAVSITLGGTPIGGSPYSSIVGAGALTHFSVENFGGGSIPTEKAATSFNIRVVARDAFDNVVPSFNGGSNTVTILSGDGATFSAGSGATAAFVNGVLASHAVTISNAGDFSITATRTSGGSEFGTSNTFTVLGVPVATAATSIVTTSFTATWTAFTDATSYRLDVATDAGFSAFVSGYQNLSVGGTSQSVTGLSAATPYYYRVRASVGGVTTSSSNTITLTTTASEPTVQASSLSISNVTANSIDLSWTNGNGSNHLVVVRQGSPVDSVPKDRASYTASATFASGSDIASGQAQYVVYNGTGNSVTVTGLSTTTTYHVAVFEFNGSGGIENYLVTSPASGNATTPAAEPTTQSSALTFSNQTTSSLQLDWTPGNGTNHLVVARAGSAVTATPTDQTSYTASSTFGSGTDLGSSEFVVYNGTGTSVTVSNLSTATTYHFAIYEFNGSAGSENYLLTSPATGNQSTTSVDGAGNADIAPNSVLAGTTTTEVVLFGAATGGMAAGGEVTVSVPANWSAPQTADGTLPGYTRVSLNGGALTTSGLSVTGSGPWTITYTLAAPLAGGGTIAVSYGYTGVAAGGAAVAPTAAQTGTYAFTTQMRSTSGGTFVTVAGSQNVDVTNSADGSGASGVVTVPASVNNTAGGNELTFTYTATTGGMKSGAVEITIPAGWSAPSDQPTDSGYVTISGGGGGATLTVSAGVITVDGVTLDSGGTLTIVYGSGGGANGAQSPSAPETSTFATRQKSTTTGNLTAITTSPQVVVH
ncbi:MAG TPA: filamin/ABP280 repeat domain-containing protein, partial [Gemmatimonadaceae bacterium]